MFVRAITKRYLIPRWASQSRAMFEQRLPVTQVLRRELSYAPGNAQPFGSGHKTANCHGPMMIMGPLSPVARKNISCQSMCQRMSRLRQPKWSLKQASRPAIYSLRPPGKDLKMRKLRQHPFFIDGPACNRHGKTCRSSATKATR